MRLISKNLLFFLINLIAVETLLAQSTTNDNTNEDLSIKIIPFKKSLIYKSGDAIGYDVYLKNLRYENQSGTLSANVTDSRTGKIVQSFETDIHFKKRDKLHKQFNFKGIRLEPNFYNISIAINTDFYEDTIQSIFSVDPVKIAYTQNKPADFDTFWEKTKEELASVDPDYSLTYNELYSTKYHRVYKVSMNSLDHIRIHGWLTIPNLKGKFPVTINFAGYLGTVSPVYYEDFASLSINIRGMGPQAAKIKPDNAEYNVYNMQDKNKYIYRGVYMDGVRAVDFVISHERMGLDAKRIVVYGGSMGGTEALIVAALSQKVNGAAANNPAFADFRTIFSSGRKEKKLVFPMVQFERYKKFTKLTDDQMFKTLDYFDLANFTDKIQCPILIGLGMKDPISPPVTIISAFNNLPPSIREKSKVFYYPNLTHEVPDIHWVRNFYFIDSKFTHPF